MTTLIAASAAYIILHRLVSGGPLRAPIVAHLGEKRFEQLFAFASAACLLWLGLGYWLATAQIAHIEVSIGFPERLLWALSLAGLWLICAGAMANNPATTGKLASIHDANVVKGILRLTRHPFLWGVAILSAGHILARPDAPTGLFFGTLIVVALGGTVSIDRKRRARLGEDWIAFSKQTSNVPFLAIIAGRQKIRFDELGLKPAGTTLVTLAILMLAHAMWRQWL
jgi:uncharacterized membrane protein